MLEVSCIRAATLPSLLVVALTLLPVLPGMIPELFRGVGGSLVVVIYDRIKYIYGV